jgi:hypothetical protein
MYRQVYFARLECLLSPIPVFTSKVDPIVVLHRPRLDIYPSSNRRQCHFASTRHMGHARPSKMVCLVGPISTTDMRLSQSRDAWAKHKDLDPYEAKWLYVATLMKACVQSLSRLLYLYAQHVGLA